MIKKLLNCRASYLDVTNSGYLSNIFSNDIGVLDNALYFNLQETVLGIAYALVFFGNAIQLNPYFAIIFAVSIVSIILIYANLRKSIVESKQFDLRYKSPIFKRLNETAQGLIQVHLFGNIDEYVGKMSK